MKLFDKKELIEMQRYVLYWVENHDEPYSEEILNKIQEMKDTFCEHEECEEQAAIILKCKDCSEIKFIDDLYIYDPNRKAP